MVFVGFTASFPFVVGLPVGFLMSGLGPLVVGTSDAIVMWWSSSVGCWGSVRSIRFRVGVGAVVYWLVCMCVLDSSCCVSYPENRDAMSICICIMAETILVLVMVDGIGSSCSTRRILFLKFSNL